MHYRQILGKESVKFVIIEEGRIVGFANTAQSWDSDLNTETTGQIVGMYLLQECWRQGMGRALMEHSLEHLRGQGFSAAVVWVLESNDRARGFYEKMGFATDGVTKVVQSNGFDLHEVRY